jgi:predicted Ser/Thr protein kinase
MAVIDPRRGTLNREQQEQLEGWLIDFDCRWSPEQLCVRVPALPADAPWRLPALIEMVKIDLERRWQCGERVGLADYLRDYPELGSAQTVGADLIRAEYDVRRQFGETVDPVEFLGPYGTTRIEELAALLAGTPEPTLVGPEPDGTLVGAAGLRSVQAYEVLGELGRGGMGVVYKARQAGLDRVVALKKILADQLAGPHERARFHAEAQAVARLQHPNIVQIHHVGEEDGEPFLVMEYVEGESLAQRLAAGPLPAQQAAELVAVLARAMDHAHSRGVVHRDLKPANVLLARTDVASFQLADSSQTPIGKLETCRHDNLVPKITDFGLAKRLDVGAGILTRPGALLGTPAYMAPEQAVGQTHLVGPAADLWSLGVILYEALTGRRPFQAESALETLRQVAYHEPVPPSALNQRLPRDLETITLECLRKEPRRRYGSAALLADDLDRFLSGEAIRARPVGAAERAWKWARRNPWVAGLVAAVLGTALAGTALSLHFALEAHHRAREAGAHAQQAEISAQKERQAREMAQKRLVQIEKANEILGSIFSELDPRAEVKGGPALRVQLGERLDEAARLLEGEAIGDGLTVARLQHLLGSSLMGLGHFEKALPLLEKARATRERGLGPDHRDTLSSKNDLALLYHVQGKNEMAESLHLEVLQSRQKKLRPNHPDILSSKNNLAAVYHAQRKYDRAEPLLLEVLRQREEQLGKGHLQTLGSKTNLANLYLAQRKYDRAESLLLEVLPLFEKQRGADHPDILLVRNHLATLYQLQRKYDRAVPLIMEGLRLRENKLGKDHPETWRSKTNLALLYQAQRTYDKAEPLFREVLQRRETKLGADHLDTLNSRRHLASLYWLMRKLDRSVPLLEETLCLSIGKLGAAQPETIQAAFLLAVNYRDANRLDDAIALFDEWLPRGQTVLTEEHPVRQFGVREGAATYQRARKHDRAEPLLRQRLDFLRSKTGSNAPFTTGAKADLASSLLAQEKYAEAETLLRDCLRIRERAQAGLWTTFSNRSMLGAALLGQKKYAEARPLLVGGYQGLEQVQAKIPPQVRAVCLEEALQRVVQLYQATGKENEAARWRKKLYKAKKAAAPKPMK